MKNIKLVLLMLAAGIMMLQGCAGVQKKEEAAVEERSISAEREAAEKAEGAEVTTVAMVDEFSLEALNDPDNPVSKRVFYFAYDSSEVSEDDKAILAKHAILISRHPELSIVVEGHADERGTREYNLALAERRAKAVERLLTLQGAAGEQLQVIGFGEERPVALGHDEEAWRLNRRVELLYSGY